MVSRDIIVVGTSAGGVETLRRLVHGLPPGFPAALFVVCHFPANARSRLPEILSRAGPLLATHAQDDEPIRAGHIYVAPPDFHMILSPGRVRLTRGPRENHHRPAIDPLFRSAARVFGPRVIGIILSGSLSDGTAGLLAVRAAGGVAIVQGPRDAEVPSMPQHAGTTAGADHVLAVSAIPPVLVQLVQHPASNEGDLDMDPIDKMPQRVEQDMAEQEEGKRHGELSIFTCPECGGAMWQVDEQEVVRFRCHVGHSYYAEACWPSNRSTWRRPCGQQSAPSRRRWC
jgi:two-component system chemotaxis response regulator CheB